ncbi:hypothetical protein ACFL2D_02220 [Patescibacteria group bacterium]
MKKMSIFIRIAVALGILIPEAFIFYLVYEKMGNLFVLASAVFLWNFFFLSIRYFVIRFIFGHHEKFREHVLTMFLTSNFLLFGFGVWVFVELKSIEFYIIPIFLFSWYLISWIGQKKFLWEIYTFVALFIGIMFGWFIVVDMGFSGNVIVGVTVYSAFISAYHWAKIHNMSWVRALVFSVLISLILTEAAWALLFWPINILSITLIMLGVFYIVGTLMIDSMERQLERRTFLNYAIPSILFFVAVCVAAEWSITF